MKKIAVFMEMKDTLAQTIIDTAGKYGYQVDFYADQDEYPYNEDVEIVMGNTVDLINKTKNLKWMSMFFAGVTSDVIETLPADCLLTNASGAYGKTMAEHMLMLTLMMLREMPVFFESSLKHNWHKPVAQKSIKDARVTVLGTGDIGTSYAKRVRSFEPKQIIAINRSGISKEDVYDKVYPISQIEEVLPQTDILAMSLPGTAQTDNIMSAYRLSLLPKGAYIVNVGRGNAIDEEALMSALNNGNLGGAGLDVFKEEPLDQDSPLWSTKNLIITPHVAGKHTENYPSRTIVEMFCEDFENYVQNKPLRYTVNRKLGY